jgi:prepilin-type N-terminal cleavage/methylation domain-containing protein
VRYSNIKLSRGFTLLEMLVSLAIGSLVIGVAVQVFARSMAATWIVSQKAEMQQDARAAINLLNKDTRLAGAGMPTGGVALTSGTGTSPVYGRDYTGKSYLGPNNNTPINFPTQTVGASTIPYLYGVIPGCSRGIQLNAAKGPTDIITIVYGDAAFPLSNYQVTFNDVNGNSVTFTSTNAADAAVNNPGVGLKQGDLVLFQAKLGNGGAATTGYAIAEVTAAAPAGGGPTYTVLFGNADPLLLNQNAGTAGDLKQIVTTVGAVSPGAFAKRIWMITYYLWNQPNPSGAGVPTPVLMRQVNGRVPVPVAENVADLRFTYDTYDTAGNLLNATCDGGQSIGVNPNQIRTINVTHLTFRSQLPGARSILGPTQGYQSLDVQNSVSARNLSFTQRYQ